MIPRGWAYFSILWRLKESWKNITLICPSFAIAWQWYNVLTMNGFHFARTPMLNYMFVFVYSSRFVLVFVLKKKGIHFSRAPLKLNDLASPSWVNYVYPTRTIGILSMSFIKLYHHKAAKPDLQFYTLDSVQRSINMIPTIELLCWEQKMLLSRK